MTTADDAAGVRPPSSPAGAGEDGGTPAVHALDGTWRRDVRWWDAAFYLIVGLSALALLTTGVDGARLAVSLAALGAIVLAYALLGARAARTRDERLALAYLLLLIPLTVVVVAQDTLGTLLLFAAFTQIWMLDERRWVAVALCALLAVGTTGALAWDAGLDRSTFWQVLPQMGVAFAFSVGLGLWVAHTMRQTERHARLVDELHATQAQLAASHHAAGVAAERERMAGEIHDTLAQGFTSVVMLAQAATADLDRDDPHAARERLAAVEATARDNLAEARALVAASSPVALQDASLPEALRRLGARFAAETGVHVEVEVDDAAGSPGPPDPATDVVLLRAAQEALANVRRHAGARRVRVRLVPGAATGRALEVVDDGRGIPAGTAEGFGLRGMRERVTGGGGRLDVGPGDDGGTRVRVLLPGTTGSSTTSTTSTTTTTGTAGTTDGGRA